MKNKKTLCITAVLLTAVIAVSAVMVLTREKVNYSLLTEFNEEKPAYINRNFPAEAYVTLGTVGDLTLEYAAEDNIFYIKNSKNGAAYSTGAAEDYYPGELSLGARFPLCQVSYTDFGGNNDVFSSSDTQMTVNRKPLENGAALELYFEEYKIGFTIEVWLNGYGIRARIPSDSIKEEGGCGITSVALFPMLGAATDGERSYAVYPDGCGSLCRLTNEQKPESPVITNVYFDPTFDLDTAAENSRLGNLNALLPVYGICRGSSAVAAYVTEGDQNSFVTLTPSTETFGLNRLYMSCRYRKQYSYISPSDVEINETERKRSAGDFSVQYIFIDKDGENGITYSKIAAELRGFMQKTDRLNTAAVKNKVNLQFIMGTRQNSSMQGGFVALTTFEQVKEITESLNTENGEELRLFLLGWQKNGYGLNPAGDTVSGKLGGKKGLKSLNKWAEGKGLDTYLAADYIYAQKGGSGFNKNGQAVYNEADQPITNSNTTEFLLNPLSGLKKLLDKRLKYLGELNAYGVAFDKMGNFIYDDYQSGKAVNRKQCAEAYASMLSAVKEKGMATAVQSGNAYVLKGAEFIYDLPERNSEYSGLTEAIPFYQLIVHGSIGYCGTVPGNMAPDYETEKLKWIEYGAQPYFVLTYESSELLRDTYVTSAFATEYSAQAKRIKECIAEFGEKLSFTAENTMTEHKRLSEDLVRVAYSDGHIIYINYGENDVTADGVTVKAKDYTVRGSAE